MRQLQTFQEYQRGLNAAVGQEQPAIALGQMTAIFTKVTHSNNPSSTGPTHGASRGGETDGNSRFDLGVSRSSRPRGNFRERTQALILGPMNRATAGSARA